MQRRGEEEQVAGPARAEFILRGCEDSAGGVGHDDGCGAYAVEHHEVAQSLRSHRMGDRGEWDGLENFVGAFDPFCGEAEAFGGILKLLVLTRPGKGFQRGFFYTSWVNPVL